MKYSDYSEKKPRGKKDFHIQLYSVDEKHLEYIMPLHWHKELEFIKVTRGEFCLYINNEEFVLHKGDVAVVNCRALHRGIPHDCHYECVVFSLDLLIPKYSDLYEQFLAPLVAGKLAITPVIRPDSSVLYSQLCRLFKILQGTPEYYELSTVGCLFSVMENFYLQGEICENSISKLTVTQHTSIVDLIEWIDENYKEHITLERLSQIAGITPNYLCKLFKDYTGKTPFDYINSIRIENVCFAIQTENKNITEIAMEHGFSDISYFCKTFKKYCGVSARKYKNSFA